MLQKESFKGRQFAEIKLPYIFRNKLIKGRNKISECFQNDAHPMIFLSKSLIDNQLYWLGRFSFLYDIKYKNRDTFVKIILFPFELSGL